MTSDQQAQIEQIESHAQALRTDLHAALAKQPDNEDLILAAIGVGDVVRMAKKGILEQ